MSQWGVQMVIGKLLTDREFRWRFERRRRECLSDLVTQGIELNEAESAALAAAPGVWSAMAARIDRRLVLEAPGRRTSSSLTTHQENVVRGVVDGLSNKQIAAALGVSEGAVKATLQHVFRKTEVRTRALLVRLAMEGQLDVRRGTAC